MDLSGSMQGAGGVGGLLAVTEGATTHYPVYDGNGNVSEYVDATGIVVAHYEYDAFGKATPSSTNTKSFTHQFSTKQLDDETGLNYYGYRYYDSANGRWLGRDPIEEDGGYNLYGMIVNDTVNLIDMIGLHAILERGVHRINLTSPEIDLKIVKGNLSIVGPVFWNKFCCIKNRGTRVFSDPDKVGTTQYIVSTSFEKGGGIKFNGALELNPIGAKKLIRKFAKKGLAKKYHKYLYALDGKISIKGATENLTVQAHYDGCRLGASWAKSSGKISLAGDVDVYVKIPKIDTKVGLKGSVLDSIIPISLPPRSM
jgi:RHS repeat-associated protein